MFLKLTDTGLCYLFQKFETLLKEMWSRNTVPNVGLNAFIEKNLIKEYNEGWVQFNAEACKDNDQVKTFISKLPKEEAQKKQTNQNNRLFAHLVSKVMVEVLFKKFVVLSWKEKKKLFFSGFGAGQTKIYLHGQNNLKLPIDSDKEIKRVFTSLGLSYQAGTLKFTLEDFKDDVQKCRGNVVAALTQNADVKNALLFMATSTPYEGRPRVSPFLAKLPKISDPKEFTKKFRDWKKNNRTIIHIVRFFGDVWKMKMDAYDNYCKQFPSRDTKPLLQALCFLCSYPYLIENLRCNQCAISFRQNLTQYQQESDDDTLLYRHFAYAGAFYLIVQEFINELQKHKVRPTSEVRRSV